MTMTSPEISDEDETQIDKCDTSSSSGESTSSSNNRWQRHSSPLVALVGKPHVDPNPGPRSAGGTNWVMTKLYDQQGGLLSHLRDDDEEERKRKAAEIDAKKAEVRKRLEEASKAKQKAKKGFMTPERKKKLRLLLRKKAAEELKKEQERKAQERRRIIEERCGHAKNLDGANEGNKTNQLCFVYQKKKTNIIITLEDLKDFCKQYHKRITSLEGDKFDLEYEVRKKDFEPSFKQFARNTMPESVHLKVKNTIASMSVRGGNFR
ncbi:unnamed protein product [Notodromas monacha]|uniref:Troponin I n=1 Tax=Notodromas monacha TaxID=399045 RepID=A0A7R9BTL2_9CRUS|nr:unnamed protein product [Notodromas monacha]CAG0920122.1 unnamed protein product [Notodromas monacha]